MTRTLTTIAAVATAVAASLAAVAPARADDSLPQRAAAARPALPPLALRSGLPARKAHARRSLAGYGFTFFLNDAKGWSARCNFSMLGFAGNYKVISVDAPIVYAADVSSEWVYWRPVYWNAANGLTILEGDWQRGAATQTSPAPLSSAQAQFTGDYTFANIAVETEVYWYSPYRGWVYANVPVNKVLVSGNIGVTIQSFC